MLFMVASGLLALVLTLAVVTGMRRLYHDAALFTLLAATEALANHAPIPSKIGTPLSMAIATTFCDTSAAGTRLRVTVLAADGAVLGDSRHDASSMENHAGRPEIARALRGQSATAIRRSPTLGIDQAYAAVPLVADGLVIGALRLAMDAPDLTERITPSIMSAILAALILAGTMTIVTIRLGARVTKPVEALMAASRDWSAGRLDRRVMRFSDPELAVLADTMNAMASELSERIRAMERQQRELSAILDGMAEAVLATNAALSVRLLNKQARRLFSGLRSPHAQATTDQATTDPAAADRIAPDLVGRSLLQVSGSSALDDLARRCIQQSRAVDEEIVLYGTSTSTVFAMAAPLAMDDGRLGAILVLNDITRLKRLEQVRKDFVSNVSHELRTPITLIRGFVETLEDGAIHHPDEASRFLAIIRRHADRMAAIIADLLTLASLEHPAPERLPLRPQLARLLIDRSIESLGNKPAARGITISIECPDHLEVLANEGLLEQALVNMLDNAIKYGPAQGTVRIRVVAQDNPAVEKRFVRFSVSDSGPGIPARDLPRLFERFYRVDRARSQELGGTGLGLAIVRHIALAHGGQASATSREGYGSEFSITVPLRISQTAAPSADTETTNS